MQVTNRRHPVQETGVYIMTKNNLLQVASSEVGNPPQEGVDSLSGKSARRRSFLKGIGIAGAAAAAGSLLANVAEASSRSAIITVGDVAILDRKSTRLNSSHLGIS